MKKKLSICCIARNEGLYLREWLKFHLGIGVTSIFLYDNDSCDNTKEICSEFQGKVRVIDWKTVEGKSPQLTAYNHFIENFSKDFEFALCIDLDEFLVFEDGHDLSDFLKSVPNNIGAIGINQRVFGSNGLLDYDDLPVTGRFLKCNLIQNNENLFFKSIFRPHCVVNFVSSHALALKNDYFYSDSFFDLENFDNVSSGQSKVARFGRVRINHYILKSKAEFMIKRERGGVAATTAVERLSRYENEYWFFTKRDEQSNLVEDRRADDIYTDIIKKYTQ